MIKFYKVKAKGSNRVYLTATTSFHAVQNTVLISVYSNFIYLYISSNCINDDCSASNEKKTTKALKKVSCHGVCSGTKKRTTTLNKCLKSAWDHGIRKVK